MSGSTLKSDGHLGVLLTELRLPTMKRLAADLCDPIAKAGPHAGSWNSSLGSKWPSTKFDDSTAIAPSRASPPINA